MKNMSCDDIEKILVDYSDGISPEEENIIVLQHLENCENCQNIFKALTRSLELTNVLWEDNLQEIENIKIQKPAITKKVPWIRYVSIAASIAIIVTTGFLWQSFHKEKEPAVQLTFEQIEQNINDSANAARLLAATELLENHPEYKEMVENQYRYIAQNYPATSAAERIKLKIQ